MSNEFFYVEAFIYAFRSFWLEVPLRSYIVTSLILSNRLYTKAKKCIGYAIRDHCKLDKPRPNDKFNPFCLDWKDPPGGGAIKAYISSTLIVAALAVYALF